MEQTKHSDRCPENTQVCIGENLNGNPSTFGLQGKFRLSFFISGVLSCLNETIKILVIKEVGVKFRTASTPLCAAAITKCLKSCVNLFCYFPSMLDATTVSLKQTVLFF